MRIISKLRDYYDSGAAFGIDQNVVFERKPVVFKKGDPFYKTLSEYIDIPYSFFNGWYGDEVYYNTTPDLKGRHRKLEYLNYQLHKVSIIVAGVKYCGKMLVSKDWTPICKSEVKYFWTKAEYNDWIKTQIDKDFHNQFESTEDDFKPTTFSLREGEKEYLLQNRIVSIALDIRHDKFSRDIVVNGDNLVLYGLQRIIDATTMFHNIDQYISTLNDPSRKMIEISDKDKIAKHGMDKTSFRNV
jgi:hypothetical protein